MLRVVLFDLGLTLIDRDERPFPHALDAVGTIRRFTTAGGAVLLTALVSDVESVPQNAPAAAVRRLFERYLAVLDRSGVRPLFEPVARRVTLSAHAGVFKPERQIFMTALRRLRSTATLDQCVLITEDAAHVASVRTELGMQALHFAKVGMAAPGFDDWRQAPAIVARLIEGNAGVNGEAAIRRFLHVAHAFDTATIAPVADADASTPPGAGSDPGAISAHGTRWLPLDESAGPSLQGVLAPHPATAIVRRRPTGEIRDVTFEPVADAAMREATSFANSLSRHGQIAGEPGPPPGRETHDIEVDDQGRRKLVRKRFRAF